jgi:PAS domain S-box-containing protein
MGHDASNTRASNEKRTGQGRRFVSPDAQENRDSRNSWTATARLTAFSALAYALLGAAGLTLATASGYASPVFPAAGLALACALSFGRRALLGIWLGAVLVNMIPAWLHGAVSPSAAALSFWIAAGATAQAWAGAWLVTRWLGPAWRDLESDKDAFLFLFLGGGLACVLSAAIGVTGLFAGAIVQAADFLYTWWTWYVGDLLGVLVFAPLTLCLLYRGSGLWRERRKSILVPMLFILGLAAMAFYVTARWERQEQESHIQNDGKIIAGHIEDRLITHREVLSSLKHFIEATPDFSFSQFEQFTRITLQDNPDIFALSFNDLVTDAMRPAFESRMSRLSPLGRFRIMERNPQGQLVPAALRPEYVTVRYIVPLAANKPAVGYDINSEPVRRSVIHKARAAHAMAVTPPVQLVQELKKRVGILELLPVDAPPDARGGADRLAGFAVAVVKVDEMIDIATRGRIPVGMEFQLLDPQTPDGRGLLYRSNRANPGQARPAGDSQWQSWLHMGDRDWLLSVYTDQSYRQQHRPWLAWAVGVAGLLFASLLQILLLGTTGRTAVILRKNEEIRALADTLEANVAERTAQLSEANVQLKAEINERRAAEEALKEREGKINAILRNTVDGIISISEENIIETFNPAAERIFGYAAGEVIGRNLNILMPEPHHSRHDQYVADYLRTGAKKVIGVCTEEMARRKDGTLFQAELAVSEVIVGDRRLFTGVVRDITERKKAEQEIILAKELAEEATRSKSEFLASMSHEIRTPMNAIIGMADMLLDSPLSAEQLKYVTVFRNSGENLLYIINEILDFSKIEAGQVRLEAIPFSLKELVRSILDIMAVKASEKDIDLSYALAADTGDWFVGDPNRLRQILLNLIGNALKFTDAGSVRIAVERTGPASGDGAPPPDSVSLLFSVRDTGIGIPQEMFGKIFEKFTQADSSMSRKFGGSGLGLAICRQLVVLMGGKIWVESAEGAGSTFYFTVRLKKGGPQEETRRAETAPRGPAEPEATPAERPLKILLVEDNPDNRLLIQSYLKKLAHGLDTAVNGQEALDRVRGGAGYDVILMDVQMPVMDGYTATRLIREWERGEGLRPAVIVALTAHAMQEDRQKSLDAGCDDHLTKPIKKQEMLSALQEYGRRIGTAP